jgi:NAD(P)-dependent dehydrogenase (short-subunit alcohol dehydrogenase family)
MARVLLTGSSHGLGLMVAELLAHIGHAVLHASQRPAGRSRSSGALDRRARRLRRLGRHRGDRQVVEQANALGRYDAVVHNAGLGYQEPRRVEIVDGLSHVFAVNVLAPYLLTALITYAQPAGLSPSRARGCEVRDRNGSVPAYLRGRYAQPPLEVPVHIEDAALLAGQRHPGEAWLLKASLRPCDVSRVLVHDEAAGILTSRE